MTIEADIKLPYDFDLHFDIKTLQQLKREYVWAKEKVALIETLCEEYDIPLKD